MTGYQDGAARTICPQDVALLRLTQRGPAGMQLLHSVIGMMGELGEICSLLQKVIWYGKDIDEAEFRKQLGLEFGDAFWYGAEGLGAVSLKLETVLQANLDKLKVRFPERYSDYRAAHENRDRVSEEAVVKE
jgi:hypothetical protein